MRYPASLLFLIAVTLCSAAPLEGHLLESSREGPTVMIIATATSGGAAALYALDELRHWKLARGKVVLIPVAKESLSEQAAQDLSTTKVPTTPFEEKMKHDWQVVLRDDVAPRPAEAISKSAILGVAKIPAQTLAALVAEKLNADRWETQMTDDQAETVLSFTTTAPKQTLAVRAREHRLLVHALLTKLEMLENSVTPETMVDPAAKVRVALFDGDGSAGAGVPRVVEIMRRQPETAIVRVSSEDIAAGALAHFNVTVFTGGSGSKQAGTLGEAGRVRVGEFVRGGGGYLGICAGSYLACQGFSWGLGILNAKTASPKWRRGRGTIKIELSEQGKAILGDQTGEIDCRYGNGPILVPAKVEGLPEYEPLALYRTELAENGTPPGLMLGSPAIVGAPCGKGRVICISPHPEQTPGLEGMVERAVAWVRGP